MTQPEHDGDLPLLAWREPQKVVPFPLTAGGLQACRIVGQLARTRPNKCDARLRTLLDLRTVSLVKQGVSEETAAEAVGALADQIRVMVALHPLPDRAVVGRAYHHEDADDG